MGARQFKMAKEKLSAVKSASTSFALKKKRTLMADCLSHSYILFRVKHKPKSRTAKFSEKNGYKWVQNEKP
tara:strand:- start:104 stop:316 length:213 start_codon:yes stop_codon:yes gene_type:complete